ncbi:MAG: type II and III secretion system protein family protein [Desulfobaccales bacterium]
MESTAHRLRWLGWIVILCFLAPMPAPAATLLDRVKNQEINQLVHLKVGRSKVLRTPFALTRISVADPDIADLILISEREIYVNALAPGVTNISMWGKSRFTSTSVTVEADLTLLKEKLHQILPKEKIGVEAAGDSIVMSGEVSGPVAQSTALSLARAYAGGEKGEGKGKDTKVVNLMHIGGVQQVMLEVRIAEINRMVAQQIGINFTAVSPSGNFGVSQLGSLASVSGLGRTINPSAAPSTGGSGAPGTVFDTVLSTNLQAMAGWKAGGILWTVFLNLLKQNNLGRVLAEPNLVTTSGQKASFLAGGSYPYPVPQTSGGGTAITIQFQQYGVQLEFTPTVLDDNKIAIKVHPIVSELDYTNAVTTAGYTVPGLLTREMNTQVEVRDGQTFSIAGLLKDTSRNVINKFPVLGDIPVLGALFRSTQYQKNETELVALVTSHLVKPIPPGKGRLPTDKWIDPSEVDIYLLGLEQGRAKPVPKPPPPSALPPGFGNQSVN